MNKQVTVTFEFDVESQTVSKLKCFVDGVESKKKTTRSAASKKEVVLEDKAVITREPNKLVLNNRAVADLGLVWQDRLILKYEKVKDLKDPFPIVGKDEAFDEPGSGNKMSKTNTVAYRGKANGILENYGTEFTLEPYGDSEGIFKLVSLSNEAKVQQNVAAPSYEKVEEEAEELDVTIFTDEETEEEFEIEELPFKLP